MRKFRQFAALAMAALLTMGMSTAAMADPSITINPANTAANTESLAIEYTYYQILEASIDSNPVVDPSTGATTEEGQVAYFVTTQDRATQLTNTGIFNVTKVDGENKWYVELKVPETDADQIIGALSASTFDKSKFPTGTFNKTADETSAESGALSAGYYYIESSLGTKIAVQTLSEVTINEKNTYPGVVKTVDANDAYVAIDDEVNYTVKITLPESVASKEVVLYDTITKGLTLNTAVTVSGAVTDPAYTSATFVENNDYTATAGEKQYMITIPAATVLANKGKTLTFTYTAKVNEQAVVLQSETNKAHVTYDNYTTVDVTTEVKTLAFDMYKVDAASSVTILAGAEFKLYDAQSGGNEIKVVLKEAANENNGNVNIYRVAKADETGVVISAGKARIEGLDNKTYYLEETKAPTGYNQLTGRASVDVTEDSSANTVDIKVENNKGATLPSTGGMGTTIFYIVGAVLVLGAGILLVTRKRMSE